MRSSDWSSDVCSSDLQQAFPTGSIVRLSPVPVEVRDVDRTVAHVAAHHQGRYSVDLHLAQDPMMTQDRAEMHVRRLEAKRRLIGAPARQPDGSRSEEHTSELQSLMRISYAVFCVETQSMNYS